MKKAYIYLRISDEDQSNFSISGQQIMIEHFAKRKDIQILKTYVDDGVSAGSFNRPQWRALEADIKKNKNSVDYLIVMKYDRLIRNLLEGLKFIETLENSWHIRLLSAMEDYNIHPEDPEFVRMRQQKLMEAEHERGRISDRSKFGVWSAKLQGRFIGHAPFGYDNARDEKGKPIITVNILESKIVQQIYQDFIDDVPFTLIMQKVIAEGFSLKGHDALKRLLSNHAYAGLIVTPSYKDEVSRIVKGNHEPIISENLFWKSYYKLQDKIRPQGPKVIDENVPLRGLLLCKVCGGYHTAAKSKGRSSFYYYYRCDKDKQFYNSTKTHNELKEVLSGLSFSAQMLTDIQIEVEKQLGEVIKHRDEKLSKANKDYDSLRGKIERLEEKYINDKIEEVTYRKWKNTFERDLNGKAQEISELTRDENESTSLISKAMPKLSDINFLYESFPIDGKHALLKSIFLGGFSKESEGFGTGLLHPLFYQNSLKISKLLSVKTMGENTNFANSPISTRRGNELEPLLRVIAKYLRCA